ncbi:TIGR03086 family metal-binding protein [Kitasatospora sp. NPDC057940]|uniref:TIGR03086 family metal-binding protein n=1 Tax=Kitasatospora sp. NPDC057940 TaxID=3346285 RepID=UPI0036DB9EB9
MHVDEVDEAVLLSIGEVARRTGLSVKLIRHWSDTGVVPPARRTAAGYRRYDPASLGRLELARTLRELGLDLAAIRAVLDREHTLTGVAAAHVDALEVRIRLLRTQQAVLRSVARRTTTAEGLAFMTRTARMSAAERRSLIHDFVAGTLAELDVPTYRREQLAAVADLPEDPTDEQVDAWIELSELVAGPELRAGMRRLAEYSSRHAPGEHDESALRALRQLAEDWNRRVAAAMREGIAPDSPAADSVVAAVVAAWIPSPANTGGAADAAADAAEATDSDGAPARRRLLEQLTAASEPSVERYWQLLCVLNGQPVAPGVADTGAWLKTALRANPAPGARDGELAALYGADADAWRPGGVLDACERVQNAVAELLRDVHPDQLNLPTPCDGWDVRALIDHIVWENLLWGGLARGFPRTDVGADHLGDDHVGAFLAAARDALTAFRRPGMLDRRFGPAPGRRLVEQLVIELLLHGWDLAAALGRPRDFLPDLAELALPVVREIYDSLPRTPGGSFAPPRPVPPAAPVLDHLAGYLGRTVT